MCELQACLPNLGSRGDTSPLELVCSLFRFKSPLGYKNRNTHTYTQTNLRYNQGYKLSNLAFPCLFHLGCKSNILKISNYLKGSFQLN